MIWLKLIQKLDPGNVNNVFVFAKQCQQIYYTYTPSFKNDRSRVDWLSVLNTKLMGHVEVV
jgi:hypothetical protein